MFLGTDTAADYTFANTTGMDLIDCGSISDFLFIDKVAASYEPTNDANGNNGIKVQGGTDSTLKIDETDNADDTYIDAHTVSGNTLVTVTDAGSHVGRSRLGSGVSNLVIRTNDLVASDYYGNSGDGTLVIVPNLAADIHLTVDTGAGTYDEIIIGNNGDVVEQAVVETGAGNDLVELEYNNASSTADVVVDFVYASGLDDGNELDVFSQATAHLQNAAGTSSHSEYLDTVVVAAGASLSIDGTASVGAFGVGGTDGGSVTVSSAADLTIETTSSMGSLEVEDTGIVTLAARSDSTYKVLIVEELTIDIGTSTAGTLDLTNNAMIIDYSSSSPAETVRTLIGRGYNHRYWDGDGITSSSAAAHANDTFKTALGFAETEAGELNISAFAGQSVDATAVVIRYTWFADSNLDGNVNLDDLTYFAGHFNVLTGQTWLYGDYDYDGGVTLDDATQLYANFNVYGFPPAD